MAKEKIIDEQKLIEYYNEGISILQISHLLNVPRQTLNRRIIKLGLKVRTGTEANLIRFGKMTELERKSLTKKCNKERRGYKYTQTELIELAKKRTNKSCNAGFFEFDLALILMELGYKVEIQKGCGKYQIDIVVNDKYAIEMGKGMTYSVHTSADQINSDRVAEIFNSGYKLIEITFSNVAAVILGFNKILPILVKSLDGDNNVVINVLYHQIRGLTLGKGLIIKESIIDEFINQKELSITKIELVPGLDRSGNIITNW